MLPFWHKFVMRLLLRACSSFQFPGGELHTTKGTIGTGDHVVQPAISAFLDLTKVYDKADRQKLLETMPEDRNNYCHHILRAT